MSSKRSRRKIPYCLISNQTGNRWYEFNLQKNHLFGEDKYGKFVVKGIDEHYIYIYRGVHNVPTSKTFDPRPSLRGAHIWHEERIPRSSITGQLILKTHAETGMKPVQYKSTHKLVKELYNPRNTVWDSGFQKMPHMMIPGGGYANKRVVNSEEVKRSFKTGRVNERRTWE